MLLAGGAGGAGVAGREGPGDGNAAGPQGPYAAAQPVAEVGGRGVEEQPGHVAAVRDLEPHRPDPPGDPVEQAELPLLTHPLGAAGALGADVSQERGVRVGDRPPQQGAQSLVRAHVLVVVAWCRQRQGVDGASPPRVQPTTTAGGSASPRTSSTRPSRCANSSGRPPSMSGSDARSARTARRAIVAGGSRRPYASATARMAAMTSLLDEPMPSPSGTSPLRVNSPPRHGAWPRRAAHSSIASAAARSAFARSAGNTVSCPGEVPGLGVNSARVPGPCIGSVTRPAQGRSFSSRKTPCRISPWWHAANPTPMRLAPPPPPVPPYAVTSRPPRGSGTASSARRRTARTGRARRTGR